MTVWAMLGAAAALWVAAALAALIPARAGEWVSAALGGLGGLAALASGIMLLLMPDASMAKTLGGNDVVGVVTLRLTPLAGVFVALLGAVAVGIAGI